MKPVTRPVVQFDQLTVCDKIFDIAHRDVRTMSVEHQSTGETQMSKDSNDTYYIRSSTGETVGSRAGYDRPECAYGDAKSISRSTGKSVTVIGPSAQQSFSVDND